VGEECERLSRELGYQPSSGEVCRLAALGFKVLKPVLDRIGARRATPLDASFDPEAPRLTLRLEAEDSTVMVDVAPDGVEETIITSIAPGLDEEAVEEAVAETIEGWSEAQGVDEYDVDYDPGDGVLRLTLHARLLEDLPPLHSLLGLVRGRAGMGTANASEQRGDDALDHRQAS